MRTVSGGSDGGCGAGGGGGGRRLLSGLYSFTEVLIVETPI